MAATCDAWSFTSASTGTAGMIRGPGTADHGIADPGNKKSGRTTDGVAHPRLGIPTHSSARVLGTTRGRPQGEGVNDAAQQPITEVAKVYEGASSSGPRTPRMYVWEIPTRRLQQQARQSECLVSQSGEVGMEDMR